MPSSSSGGGRQSRMILKNGSVILRHQLSVATTSGGMDAPNADGKFADLSNASPSSTRRRSLFVRLKSFALGGSASTEDSDGMHCYLIIAILDCLRGKTSKVLFKS